LPLLASRLINFEPDYLLDPWCCGEANHPIHLDKGPANNKKIQPVVEATSAKPQAASNA